MKNIHDELSRHTLVAQAPHFENDINISRVYMDPWFQRFGVGIQCEFHLRRIFSPVLTAIGSTTPHNVLNLRSGAFINGKSVQYAVPLP